MERLLHLRRDETGAAAVEYSLLMVGIALAVAGRIAIFGTATRGLFAGAIGIFPG
jgi:Flp pilus assembly pilin Flp